MELSQGIWLEGQYSTYCLRARLGYGGMAEVWRAQDAVGTEVAIKYPTEPFSPLEPTRFTEEVRITRRLPPHAHCIRGLDAGVYGDRPFLVTELINGVSLRRFKAESTDRWLLSRQLLLALEHCHRHRFIHLDIKPENILCWRSANGYPYLKLLDFGVAVDLDRATSRPAPQSISGTICYMSPEQVCGRELDERADLFIVGIVLYEMWTNARFMRPQTTFDGIRSLMDPEYAYPPCVTGNASLDRLITRLLAQNRDKRPKSAVEALQLLEDAWLSE